MGVALSWLPLVRREMNVAVRRKSVYQVRGAAVGVAVAAGMFSLVFGFGAWNPMQQGKQVFTLITGYAYGLTLLAGVLLASDTISQEKREGTLGLLFLTDLKPYDVVLGKLAGCSVNAFYGLVALLPVIALPMLMGGVTWSEFWRTSLSLGNALFWSLGIGLAVSAFSWESGRSSARALGILLVFGVGWPFLMQAGAGWGIPGTATLAGLSPLPAFRSSDSVRYAADSGAFWTTLMTSHLFAWLAMAATAWFLSRNLGWHDGSVRYAPQPLAGHPVKPQARSRGRFDDSMPVFWLIGEDASSRRLAWMLVLAWGVVALTMVWALPGSMLPVIYGGKVCGFLLKLVAILHATRFFVQGRQTGMLESLAATPLTTADLVQGQWQRFRQTFLAPVAVFLGIQALPVVRFMWFGTGHLSENFLSMTGFGSGVFLWVWVSLSMLLDLGAVMYFGMWLALSMKQPRYANSLTLLLALILPSFAFCSVFPMFSFCSADMLASVWFISWARRRLNEDFRAVITRN